MKKIFLTILGILALTNLSSQTANLKILQYNLLYYGLNQVGCNNTNNNITTKSDYLKTIINYTEPDIFSVNEINANNNIHNFLLNNVFLQNGHSSYKRAKLMGSYLTSQVFYNTQTLTLYSCNDNINSSPRKIHEYIFYYNSPDLTNGDTVFFSYFVAHYKAGNSGSDREDRKNSSENLMNYLNNHDVKNYILVGDLNLYKADEDAYQILTDYTNPNISFIDPGVAGNWHDNASYADYHTQSTFYTNNGCGASGGLDDRFDFILFSPDIDNDTYSMKYKTSSFETIGQDGNHFNSSIDWQGNSSIPSDLLNAISKCSDHLPITAEFMIEQQPIKIENIKNNKKITFNNPFDNKLTINSPEKIKEIAITDILGRYITTTKSNSTPSQWEHIRASFPRGSTCSSLKEKGSRRSVRR